MKRSTIVRTTLIGASAFAIMGCKEDRVEGHTFENLQQCVAENPNSPDWVDQCEKTLSLAEREHEKNAPKYDSLAVCEDQHGDGNCARPGGGDSGSFFLPLMAGYMMGNLMSDGGSRYYSRPLYQGSNGRYYTSTGGRVGSSLGNRVNVRQSATQTPRASVNSQTLTRSSVRSSGGFGARATAGGTSRGTGSYGG